jgi:hypothetical protein
VRVLQLVGAASANVDRRLDYPVILGATPRAGVGVGVCRFAREAPQHVVYVNSLLLARDATDALIEGVTVAGACGTRGDAYPVL